MATLVLRAGKGSPLTNAEVDANFTNLNTEVAAAATTASWSGVTGKPATLAGFGITDAQPLLVSGTSIKTVNGQSVLGSGNIQIDGDVTSFNTRTGAVTLGSSDVTTALGYTPYNATNPSGFISGINSSMVTTALGFTPYNATNPSGYITASASITGNAASATRLINLRTINGVGFDGTANITVADATKLPLSGGTVAGVLIGNGGFANVDGGIRIANPGGASYATSASTVTGAIKIRLPAAALGSNSMISFRVRVYQYSTGLTQEFVIAGYNYSDAAGTWYNVSALNLSDAGGDFTVRFGKDATSQCVYIGELNSSWSYPQVHVVDFSGGYSGMAASTWATDWNISFETSAFAGVTSSRTAWRSLSAGNYNSYAPSLTGTGASGTWGISITGSAATLTTGRTIAMTGDVTYISGSFNGSANVTGTATLAASGVTAGTYTKVTVDAKGRVTVGASLASADLPTYTGTLTSGQITTGLGFTPASRAGATFTGAIAVSGESTFYNGTYVDPDSGVGRAIKVGALGIAVLGGIKTDTLNSTGAITQNGSQVLHAGNYNTYAPTLTGTGASGSWGISVTGNAATVTNGLVSTGSYADPSWITSLASSKLTGTIDNARLNGGTYTINVTGNAGTATTLQTARTINGVSFNGSANITVADSTKLPLSGGTLSGGLVINSGSTNQLQLNTSTGTQSLWIRAGYDSDGSATPAVSAFNVQFQSSGSSGGTFSFVSGNTKVLAIGGSAVNSLVPLQQSGNQVLHAGNYSTYSPSYGYFDDYQRGAYRVIADHGSQNTWYIRSNGRFTWARAHDWSQTFDLDLSGGGTNANDGWARFGQQTSNSTAGTWRGTRFVQYTGSASIDGFVRAGRYYLGDDSNYLLNAGDGSLRVQTVNGYVDIGPKNASWCHIYSDRDFYTNRGIWISGSRVLDAGNYTSYSPSLTGSGASGTWGINVTGASQKIGIPSQQTEYTILDGPANGPVIKLRYDGATSNRYLDIGFKDGNGVFYTGLKIYNGDTPAWNGSTLLHASNYSSYALPLSGGSISGNLAIRSTGPTIFMRDTNNNSAMLHCNSNLMYILRGGVDTESWTQVGGYWPVYWDLTNNNATFGGSIWAAGNITAYSDESVKENWKDLDEDFVERLAEVKSGTFDRTDIKKRQAGVSAQSMQKLLPEVVDYHEKEKLLSVAYGNAALASAVELAKRVVEQDKRIARLEALVEKLIGD